MSKVHFHEKKARYRDTHAGFLVIEVVVAISILVSVLISVNLYYKQALEVSRRTTNYIQSSYLLEEGWEGIKVLRDAGWSSNIATLSTTTTYYLYWTGTGWIATTTMQKVENLFVRQFTVTDVSRNIVDDDIVPAGGGVYDPDIKLITLSVSWPNRGRTATTSAEMQTYLANLLSN